jgi:tRNA A-37 threonylcarbamoyl transferase component Bud32
MFKKNIFFTQKRNLAEATLEIELQKVASKYDFCPKITETKFSEKGCEITMEKIETMCLADMYGDKAKDLPPHIWPKIHTIIKTLYEEAGIEYVDITPYNFIEHNNKIYIIDFGDAYYKGTKPRHWFHKQFLEDPSSWNPDFA